MQAPKLNIFPVDGNKYTAAFAFDFSGAPLETISVPGLISAAAGIAFDISLANVNAQYNKFGIPKSLSCAILFSNGTVVPGLMGVTCLSTQDTVLLQPNIINTLTPGDNVNEVTLTGKFPIIANSDIATLRFWQLVDSTGTGIGTSGVFNINNFDLPAFMH